ncbi:hypothetical protein HYW17_01640 [Candidatus Uhrbacteria bacterium]|nr:hypothetical protein [Candidatus Uhrbacteria bacterium]
MGWLLALVLCGTVGQYIASRDPIVTLNFLAWAFMAYMGIKIWLILLFKMPDQKLYGRPKMAIPDTVDREHLPTLEDETKVDKNDPVVQLVQTVCTKIAHAADETAIYEFVAGKLAAMRRSINERYSRTASEVNVIGFEGIIGTLIGLVAFMAQATVLFNFPSIDGDHFDAIGFVSQIAENLRRIDLITVSTAFFTSILGWGAKAYIGGWLDRRMVQELTSISEVEVWLRDEILARMTLPSRVQAILRIADFGELRGPLEEAAGSLRTAVEVVRATAKGLQVRGGVAFAVNYVAGGVEVRLLDASPTKGDAKEDGGTP